MKEYDTVVLTRSLPEYGLEAGDVGAVVHTYEADKAFEVEFVSGGGETVAVVTLEQDALRSVDKGEILHVRRVLA